MSNKIAILLATYNGEKYLNEQLQSIIGQTHTDWHLYVRDDGSTDATVSILKDFEARFENITVLDNLGEYTGSAAGNFFKLVHSSNYENFSHISFSDQDDVWAPKKLEAALSCMESEGAQGYSSNLVSYDNKMKRANYIDKSQPQKEFDYLFQGGSAGCTYVISREVCLLVQKMTSGIDSYKGQSHDWLIYAICRVHDVSWCFDTEAHIFYRQHASNVYGSMSALSGAIAKFNMLRSGWYRNNVIWIARKSGADVKAASVFNHVVRNTLTDRLSLMKMSSLFRRNKKESRLLAIIFLFFFNKV